MRFSQRIGAVPTSGILQEDSIDADLRNGIWNCILIEVIRDLERADEDDYDYFVESLWKDFFNWPIQDAPKNVGPLESKLHKWVVECEWYLIYDFLEFLCGFDGFASGFKDYFQQRINPVLEQRFSAWRLVSGQMVKIADKHELDAVEKAVQNTKGSKYQCAEVHIRSAVSKLYDRQDSDPRNSVKESISAVEAVARAITGNPKATLGDALKKLDEYTELHTAFKEAFSKMYGYTSDKGGIRHSLTDASDVTFAEAQYMLIICSGFINYVIASVK